MTTFLLTPTALTLALHDEARVAAFAFDDTGHQIDVPNGTQTRLDNGLVATASLAGNLVSVTARAFGTTGLWLSKGSDRSNVTTVSVVNGPASITIHL